MKEWEIFMMLIVLAVLLIDSARFLIRSYCRRVKAKRNIEKHRD
jgi:hypothetical protein